MLKEAFHWHRGCTIDLGFGVCGAWRGIGCTRNCKNSGRSRTTGRCGAQRPARLFLVNCGVLQVLVEHRAADV